MTGRPGTAETDPAPPRKYLDYDFLAVRIMHAFGWTIEYTLSLSWPVFIELFSLIRRVRLDNAIDAMYVPYGAAKYGEDCSRALFDGRGSFFLIDAGETTAYRYSPEDVAAARARWERIRAARDSELAKAATGN